MILAISRLAHFHAFTSVSSSVAFMDIMNLGILHREIVTNFANQEVNVYD